MNCSGVVADGLWVVMCGYKWLRVVMQWLLVVLSSFAGGYEWLRWVM